jgi:4-aminobutyrate aminotransferase-like enzyme
LNDDLVSLLPVSFLEVPFGFVSGDIIGVEPRSRHPRHPRHPPGRKTAPSTRRSVFLLPHATCAATFQTPTVSLRPPVPLVNPKVPPMTQAISFPGEDRSNAARATIATKEPVALRTFTPSQAVLAKSAGVFHYTADGRRLYDYSSGVLVANLGHNPKNWTKRFVNYLGWTPDVFEGGVGYHEFVPLTAYNAITEVEALAVERLLQSVQATPFGKRLDRVMWSASGSEAVIKALWACLHRDESRDVILATRFGFHGKKGLAGAVTGSETDPDRDPRVRFIGFPMEEIDDCSRYGQPLDLSRYESELQSLHSELGSRINCLITEPYLGGGGSYHPPKEYLQMLQNFCREHDIMFILDEVQSNFGRTGRMYAFEKNEIEPDFVTLGKGLGNGVAVSGVVGRGDIMASLKFGEASDTWSANPLASAAVLATLDEFDATKVLESAEKLTPVFFDGLNALKETGLIARVRGEGMVFGIECADFAGKPAAEVAQAIVKACYLASGDRGGIHFLGALAGRVLRVSPPMTMTMDEATDSLDLLMSICRDLAANGANAD